MRIPLELEVLAGFITFLPPKCPNLATYLEAGNLLLGNKIAGTQV
jgi:hypothetical protein